MDGNLIRNRFPSNGYERLNSKRNQLKNEIRSGIIEPTFGNLSRERS